ncbi:polyprenyl synthetase family protein [Streptococcus ictaluri]|uniref:Polyprenyl synthetase n=1 Tax=Streptococcus ictaluri 707-05 TaxID=764299 RepID=G5K391_9STRE|nr:polyprenyl synthetase family protein [Streptococcus ictaluri]EHI69384.1 polyprenyl synthetase [Streptococcus ictaluri 707-05]
MVHAIWKNHSDIYESLQDVKDIIISEMSSIHPDVKAKILDYVNAPGKYLRSGLYLYLAKESSGYISKGKCYLAASIEVLHLATLIHDDVIDQADFRRGVTALHHTYSNKIAIYSGDYLLSYAARLAAKGYQLLNLKEMPAVQQSQYYLIERILSGELSQLININNQDMTMKDYLKQIKGKTAFLFGMACQLGLWSPDISRKQSKAAYHLGLYFGMAFQITDDLIDYRLKESQSGKPRMQDVQNGIYTAPLIIGKVKSFRIRHLIDKQKNKAWEMATLESFYQELDTLKAFEETEVLIDKFLKKMEKVLITVELKQETQFLNFINQILKRSF